MSITVIDSGSFEEKENLNMINKSKEYYCEKLKKNKNFRQAQI